MTRMSRITHHAAGAIENAAGGSPFGGAAGALGAVGGPAAIAASIAAAVTAVFGSIARQQDQLKLIGIEDTAARTVQARHLQRLAGSEGTSASARSEEEAAKDEIIAREADKARIEEKNRPKWYNPVSWFKHLTAEDQNEGIENENGITLARERQAEAKRLKREKFKEIGLKEIEISEKRARGEMASAKAAEMALNYHKDIKRLDLEGADPKEQIRGADAKFAMEMRQREQSMAGLINARTGAAAAARIASLGDRQFRQAREAVAAQKIEEQTRLQREQHSEAMAARTRPKFSSPPLHA
jgi:hypothetical protein